ncbi:MAG: hypothetical protein BWY21_01836 [Parcubacteria group bacterium ADurb.Bin216]|nr:MAG: hypothetical protein BWY21_01836 [Parcubacteria group bacterium ADurb.Bin216]
MSLKNVATVEKKLEYQMARLLVIGSFAMSVQVYLDVEGVDTHLEIQKGFCVKGVLE